MGSNSNYNIPEGEHKMLSLTRTKIFDDVLAGAQVPPGIGRQADGHSEDGDKKNGNEQTGNGERGGELGGTEYHINLHRKVSDEP